MKFLLAVALFALASALPEPIRLLDPVQVQEEPAYAPVNISPLMVPQEVMDDVALKVKVVESPEIAEVPMIAEAPEVAEVPEDVNAYAVNFVEEALKEEAPEALADIEDVSAYAVNFVEEAVNEAPEALAAIEDVSAYAVNFVEEAVNAEAPEAPAVSEDASAYMVHFIEEAVNAEALEAPIAIHIMQIPLPGSVVLPLDLVLPSIEAVKVANAPAEVSEDSLGVKFVDVADVDEETPSYMPVKQYPDPRWR